MVLELHTSVPNPPALHLWRKSSHGPLDEDRAVTGFAHALRGIVQPLPVIFAGRCVAVVGWDPRNDRLYRLPPKYWASIADWDSLINAITNSGQYASAPYLRAWLAAGASQNWYDSWLGGGDPGVGALGAASTAAQFSDTTQGAIWHGGNVSPAVKVPLCFLGSSQSNSSHISCILYDRVLSYDQCLPTGALAAMTNGVTAQRYINDGFGLQVIGAYQVVGAPAVNLTAVSYTSVTGGGTAGRAIQRLPLAISSAAAIADNLPAQTLSGAYPFLALQGPDTGAQSIESFTTDTGASTFAIGLTLAKPLCGFLLPAGAFEVLDLLRAVPGSQPILDGACLSTLALLNVNTTQQIFGFFGFGWS